MNTITGQRACLIHLSFWIVLALAANARAVEVDFRGQFSAWAIGAWDDDQLKNTVGVRYIPEVALNIPVKDDAFMDAEVSVNALWNTGSGPFEEGFDVDLYRAQWRYATKQTETVIGLQKIAFGPALLLRPLRWFDRLDPTDPLQLTDGVYALRFRYAALNNANTWLWVLYGNDDLKGNEFLPTDSPNPEFGGRLQYPVPAGEVAGTVHSREVDASSLDVHNFTENRFALDGHWDLGIGLWFEAVFENRKTNALLFDWTRFLTVGLDYTIGIGNGLYVLLEHLVVALSNEPFELDDNAHFTAYSMRYPLGSLDTLTAIGLYSWDRKDYSQYVSWERTYDDFVVNMAAFYYPDSAETITGVNQEIGLTGYGAQLLFIYNH